MHGLAKTTQKTKMYVISLEISNRYPPRFSVVFTKGNNFCDFIFASLDNLFKMGSTFKNGVAFSKWGLLLKIGKPFQNGVHF